MTDTSQRTVSFTVSGLDGSRESVDLSNTMTALSGVTHVSVDLGEHSISVSYDPEYANPAIIKNNLQGAGYRVTDAT
jgi:copper chaperone CopZ